MSCRASTQNSSRRHNFAVVGNRKSRLVGGDGLIQQHDDVVKTEPPQDEEDMKDYAETAMNELLGWYGYDKVSSIEARKLGDIRVCSSSSSSSPKSRADSDDMSDRETGNSRDTGGTGTPILDVESLGQPAANGKITCAWCLKNGLKLFTLKTSENETKAFCSELCFDQCRRATFKKNRVCDWCKHVRHTVSYVDFQDKDHQLQFCSDKCLNQYKMNIFCKETQAYLQMHPHLKDSAESGGSSAAGRSNLITPDLWLKDCKESTNGGCATDDYGCTSSAETITSTARIDPLCCDDELRLTHPGKSSFRDSFKPEIAAGLIFDHGGISTKNSQSKQNEKVLPETNTVQVPKKQEPPPRYTDEHRKRSTSLLDSVLRHERSSSRLRSSIGLTDYSIRGTKSGTSRPNSKHAHGFTEPRTFNQLSPPPPTFPPPPLINGNVSSKRISAARSRSSSPMPSAAAGSPRLPPMPPLLSSDMLQCPLTLHPQLYQQQPSQLGLLAQQQFEAALFASQTNRFGIPQPGSHRATYPDPPVRTSPLNLSTTSSLMPPATVMLPYPLVVPLPVPIPIPIPIPLPEYMRAKSGSPKTSNKCTSTNSWKATAGTTNAEEQGKRVDSIVTKLMTKHQSKPQYPVEDDSCTTAVDLQCSNHKQTKQSNSEDRSCFDEPNLDDEQDSKFRSKRSSLTLRERSKRTRIT